jgi:hypothetical protein
MSDPILLPCDGCGQSADSAHISRRLRRLAWSTRFRPVHIHALLLGGIAPNLDSEFLYAPDSSFQGEAGNILRAAQISAEGKSPESIQAEFQKLGLMLIHIVECPLENTGSTSPAPLLIEKQLLSTLARIRRSLKPKRVLLFSSLIEPLAEILRQSELGCPVLPLSGGIYLPASNPSQADFLALETALTGTNLPGI